MSASLTLFGGGPQRDDAGKIQYDAYWTPQLAADACVADLRKAIPSRLAGNRWLEPSVGGGAFARAIRRRPSTLHVHDIWEEASGLRLGDTSSVGKFLEQSLPLFDAAAGNPPFGGPDKGRGRLPGDPKYLGAHHARRCIAVAPIVGMILPLEWLGVGYVEKVLWSPFPPAYFRVLTPRPWAEVKSCCWYVWIDGDTSFRRREPIRWKR